MPHSKHYSHATSPCEKPRPKPPPYVPPEEPAEPPGPWTRSWFNLIDPIMGDQDFDRLDMTLEQARACYQVLCAAIFNMSGNLWFHDCSTTTVTADVYNGWPDCSLAWTWSPAWPPDETCMDTSFPDPPCP